MVRAKKPYAAGLNMGKRSRIANGQDIGSWTCETMNNAVDGEPPMLVKSSVEFREKRGRKVWPEPCAEREH